MSERQRAIHPAQPPLGGAPTAKPEVHLSDLRTVSHAAHWGSFQVTVDGDDRIVSVAPHPADEDPSPLIGSVIDGIRHQARVARPAIRKGWLEGGPGPTGSRGSDEWVEVSWDEATRLVAAELSRVREQHGNEAIYAGSYGWASAGRFHQAQGQLSRLLNLIGGCTYSVNSYSNGAAAVILPHVVGTSEEVLRRATTWSVIAEHTDLIVAFGGLPMKNVAINAGGVTRHEMAGQLAQATARGLRVALVSPLRDDAAPGLDTDWLALVPGTDVALMLGLAHTLVSDGLVDREFLARATVGYERFEAYLTGRTDGFAKTAAWAAAICGINAGRIERLAHAMAGGRTMVSVTWSLQRVRHGEQVVWMGITLAAMLGQIGLPGGGFGHGYGSMADTGAAPPSFAFPSLPRTRNPIHTNIPVARVADMLLHPGEPYDYDGEQRTYPDIKIVHWAGGNPFHHHQDLTRLTRALCRADTVIVQDPYWTGMARHADIVLPVTTSLERNDIGCGRNDDHLIAMHRAIEPVGEARSDFALLSDIARNLGVADAFTEGRSEGQWLEHLYETWRGALALRGRDVPPFDQFWSDGGVRVGPGPDHVLFGRFAADPEKSPLPTPSGKIEIWSETIAAFAYDDCPAHPTWIAPDEWLGGERAAQFPLHLIANQPASRLHSQLDGANVSQATKVAGREPIRMHPSDAATREITDGDIVLVRNNRGACLAGAVTTEAVRTGVVQLSTGAWYSPVTVEDPAAPGRTMVICAHGNPNVLTPDVGTSKLAQGCTGQHVLVEVTRWTGPVPSVDAFVPPL